MIILDDLKMNGEKYLSSPYTSPVLTIFIFFSKWRWMFARRSCRNCPNDFKISILWTMFLEWLSGAQCKLSISKSEEFLERHDTRDLISSTNISSFSLPNVGLISSKRSSFGNRYVANNNGQKTASIWKMTDKAVKIEEIRAIVHSLTIRARESWIPIWKRNLDDSTVIFLCCGNRGESQFY